MHRGEYKAAYEQAWNDEIEKHKKSLKPTGKRKKKHPNHYARTYGPIVKKQRKTKKSTVAKIVEVKTEPGKNEDDDIGEEISAIHAEFVDFVL